MSSRKRAIIYGMIIVLVFTLIALFYTRPLVAKAGDHVLGDPGDTLLNIYTITWTSQTLGSNPFNLFNANMFYPNDYTLAYTDHQFMNCLIALPALGISQNPILALNFLVIFVMVLSAFGGFLLVFHLTGDWFAGLAGGLIFGFPLYKLSHITHVNLLSTGFIPLGFLCLHLYTERKRPVYAFLFGACTVALFWTTWTYGFFFAFAVLVYMVVLLVAKRRTVVALIRRRLDKSERIAIFKWVGFLLASFVIVVLVLIPFVRPYLEVRASDPEFKRDITTVEKFSADLRDFAIAPRISLVWGEVTDSWRRQADVRGGSAERSLMMGVVPMLMGIFGFAYLVKRRKEKQNLFTMAFYGVLFVSSIILCLGVTLNVAGQRYDIYMPYRLLYRFFPGFQAIRTPGRMVVFALLALAVFGGFSIKWIRERLSGRRGAMAAGAAVVVILAILLAEMMSTYIPSTELPTRDEFPEVYEYMEELPGSAPTAVLPMADYDPAIFELGVDAEPSYLIREPWRIYFSTVNWKSIVNGFSGYIPDTYEEAARATCDFPSEEALRFLREMEVRYVVAEGKWYDPGEIEEILDWAEEDPGFDLIEEAEGDYLFLLD